MGEEQDQNQNSSATSASTNPVLDYDDVYCSSGTAMYMDGFNWQGSTCVIYLFAAWTLSTPAKFALAAMGSILFGIVLEFVLWQRRSIYDLPPGKRRLVLSSLVYGVQLSLGYFIMLVIMTYSGPLFLCTVGGMMLGHAGFPGAGVDRAAAASQGGRRGRRGGGIRKWLLPRRRAGDGQRAVRDGSDGEHHPDVPRLGRRHPVLPVRHLKKLRCRFQCRL